MEKTCPECGVKNSGDVDSCELCGNDLSGPPAASAHPHRVPSGVVRRPPGVGDTDVNVTASRQPTDAHPALTRSKGQSDFIGEVAAQASLSGSFPANLNLCGKLKLVVEQGRIIGEQYLLSEPTMSIGRVDPEQSNYPDIDLSGQDNEYVHRRHARLQFLDGGTKLSLEHVGGHNPTLVNKNPLEEGELVELQIGDRVRIGRVLLRLNKVD